MKCTDPQTIRALLGKALDSFLHLICGLIRKGHGKDGHRRNLLSAGEIGKPVSDYLGLAAPRACKNQQRPLIMKNRIFLLSVKIIYE
jgi:hypothetical protein